MQQTWHDLLFAHWPIPPQELRPLVPTQLPLDTLDGQGWLGIVPFWMSGVRARMMPAVPGLSRFPELNFRTYVSHAGKPGVYFFSLDAASRAAVWAARTFFHLPYFHASMIASQENEFIQYSSRRHEDSTEFRARYRPISSVRLREKGSLAHWLTERYCLYTVCRNRVHSCDIHHQPWPLQDAEASIERNSIAAAANIALPSSAPLLHFVKRLEVLIWPLRGAEDTDPRV